MDPKLLLVKIITLLYKESCVKDTASQSNAIAKNVISSIKFPETGMDFDHSRETLLMLRSTALWMCENPATHFYDRAALLQRIRVNTSDDESLYFAIEQGIDLEEDITVLKRQCLSLRCELRAFLDQLKVIEILKRASQAVMFNPDTVDWKSFVRDVHAQLEPYTTTGQMDKLDGMVEEVDMGDLEHVESVLTQAQVETSNEGILRLGYQGINRMLGENGGIRRGECVVVPALQYNFKSGLTLNFFKQIALYNTPYMRDPSKTPLLLHISLENDLKLNVIWLYKNLKENETGILCDARRVDAKVAAEYVSKRLTATGYQIMMRRFNPTEMTYHTFFDMITRLEADGYEIHAVVMDYLNMMSKKGCSDGPMGSNIRDLFRRIRNFTNPRGIAFITPHQISTDAKTLIRMGVDNFVQEIANKGYYDGCKTIDQEVDLEIYAHIVKKDGASYLTVQRGKHRGVDTTPDRDLYCVLPFQPVGGIRDDVLGEDSSRRKVGSITDSGGEAPWWEAAA